MRKPLRAEELGFLWFLQEYGTGKRCCSERLARIVIGREIDRKLRLTGAALGTVTLKDLAAAFRRINPATRFDIDRAHKWLQGRARPREAQVYEDWAQSL
jgi:hypothetical protein